MNRFAFLFGNKDFLIMLMTETESGTFATNIVVTIEISSWRRILLHISFHPIWKLFFSAVAKSNSFGRVGFETAV
jgi:hypothetical protein